MKEAALIQVTSAGQTRRYATQPGYRIHPRAVARAGCVTIVAGITAAYPEISLPGIVPRTWAAVIPARPDRTGQVRQGFANNPAGNDRLLQRGTQSYNIRHFPVLHNLKGSLGPRRHMARELRTPWIFNQIGLGTYT